jgi:hypothetical protein
MQCGHPTIALSPQGGGKRIVCWRETIVRGNNKSGPALVCINLGQETPLRCVGERLTGKPLGRASSQRSHSFTGQRSAQPLNRHLLALLRQRVMNPPSKIGCRNQRSINSQR